MPRKSYPLEYRQRIVELALSGRSPESLAKEFEPAAKTIRDWVRQAQLASGGGVDDKDQLIAQLRRENANLREEREILKKAAAWFARETGSLPKRGSSS